LGWNVREMAAVKFDFNVRKLSTRTKDCLVQVVDLEIVDLKVLLSALAKIRQLAMVNLGQMQMAKGVMTTACGNGVVTMVTTL
jgi:hypothetical protein